MNETLRNKIISHCVLFCILLNAFLCSVNLNVKLDLSVTFSCVASTVTYSYNPILFTKEFRDSLLGCLYKGSDKQSKKKEERNTGGDKKNDFIIAPFSNGQIKTDKQFDNFGCEKLAIKDSALTGNPYAGFLHNNPALAAFCFMLLMWLATLFRKRRALLKKYEFCRKNI